jgi:predicted NBD/HSP70 family sugar kinase
MRPAIYRKMVLSFASPSTAGPLQRRSFTVALGLAAESEQAKLMDQRDEYPESRFPAGNDFHGKRPAGPGVDQEKVRTFNRHLILQYIRDHSPTLRVEMANRLDLSRATVSSIVKELMDDGFVLEGKKLHTASMSGKRATEIYFNADVGHIIGIDLGRSHLGIYLTNLAANILDHRAERFDTKVGWQEGLRYIAIRVNELVKKNIGSWRSVRGIGIGIPGAPDRNSKMLISPPMLNNWINIDIPVQLRNLLTLDENVPIYLENDANTGALGESRYGRGQGFKNMIYVKLSIGIGVGLILNGQLYRGENGIAGEFGHIRLGEPIEKDSPICSSCGKQGCLEALAGLHAIVNDARKHSPSPLLQSIDTHNITPDHVADVIIEAQKGDIASCAALEHAGTRIGTAIGSYLINVYNPSLILLDGGIIRPGKAGEIYLNDLLVDRLLRSAEESSLPAAWQGTKISFGKLEDDAVGLGAVATVIDRDPELNMPATP